MAKIEGDQVIPSDLQFLYEGTLTPGDPEHYWVKTRYPWKLTQMRKKGSGISPKQVAQRHVFILSKNCYNCQPYTGGITPPGWGARNRSWWYNAADGSGLWYYDYFMQQTMNANLSTGTPDWCKGELLGIQTTYFNDPDRNYKAQWHATCGRLRWWPNYIWLWRKEQNFTKLHILARGYNPGSGPHKSITIRIHKQMVEWDPNTLTWNTQPDLGAIIGTYIIVYGTFPVVYNIPIPLDHDKFCLTGAETGDDTNWISFWVREPVIEDGRAYMGS